MELNEIKKHLYREKPTATMVSVKKAGVVYNCPFVNTEGLYFEIPLNDIGDATFFISMPAQQLIRWLVLPNL